MAYSHVFKFGNCRGKTKPLHLAKTPFEVWQHWPPSKSQANPTLAHLFQSSSGSSVTSAPYCFYGQYQLGAGITNLSRLENRVYDRLAGACHTNVQKCTKHQGFFFRLLSLWKSVQWGGKRHSTM